LLSRRALDWGDNLNPSVALVNLHPDAVERASQAGVGDFALVGRAEDCVGVAQAVDHSLERTVGHCLAVERLVIVELTLDQPPGFPEHAKTGLVFRGYATGTLAGA